MSRIGKLPINLPAGVSVTVNKDNSVVVKGPKGELTQQINTEIKVSVEDNRIVLERPSDQNKDKALHGLYRSLLNNMVEGVTNGYKIEQELVGVGYRATSKGQILELALGYSHLIHLEIAPEVKVTAVTEKRANPIITLESCDKQLVGQVAAKIRSFRKPEPYKGKGVKFVGEQLRRKAGKSAGK
ncbi:50S ribosomal protein L6 [Marinifilum sp. N1E240]|uniref:50S ribosomal protein L6 n=1 Tax=Marinifilum sp. N1E240 TaxID=2608082 RepID=UPI00128BB8A6|nr:50S ribosomal protein L6 [Marinifilum sp. N1E240]MPQ45790.1 50S ribosomal protein L6 [Marinifilum sp. N1E240]